MNPLLPPSHSWTNRGRESEPPTPFTTVSRVAPDFEWNQGWVEALRTAEKVKVGDIIVDGMALETYDIAHIYIVERVNKKSITVYPCDQYGYRTSPEKKTLKNYIYSVITSP
jgi:hypothetical protein